jgi:hypothetical protein
MITDNPHEKGVLTFFPIWKFVLLGEGAEVSAEV